MDENFDMFANMVAYFVRGDSGGEVICATSNPQTRNLASRELKLEAIFKEFYLFFLSCLPYGL
jgi:hypothetical protein